MTNQKNTGQVMLDLSADEPSQALEFVVVAIGASAGGLEPIRELLTRLPESSGMAFIIVQHLDPTHDSLLVEILGRHTRMPVAQATEGTRVQVDHVYIIPPGVYLSVPAGILRLTEPGHRHGARMPFDFSLASLADTYGPNAVGVVLSGNGADGSAGLKAVTANGGLVIAQSPAEAEYDGMPKSAIDTGFVDLILPVSEIADALVKYQFQMAETDAPKYDVATHPPEGLPEIVALLRKKTPHDYTLYKPGTLQRRIERRMTLASVRPGDMVSYLDMLRNDDDEVVKLASDILIHVTGFFRDPAVFDLLTEEAIPNLIRDHPIDRPIRIWSVGCSTGEEAYSLAIVIQEALAKAGRADKLQVFASDADPASITTARQGFYSAAIEGAVSSERLERFFSAEEGGYRVLPQLRATVVFTVQDILADPPFSRLDLISCRNLLIYLGSEAQAKALSLFHFALLDNGLLLLGAAESSGTVAGMFEVVAKPARLFRKTGRSPGNNSALAKTSWITGRPKDSENLLALPALERSFTEFCRQWALESGPATVILNSKKQSLFTLGPVSRYLTLPVGQASIDVLAMVSEGLRTGLRSALQRAGRRLVADRDRADNHRVTVTTATRVHGRDDRSTTRIEVEATFRDGESMFLVRFIPVDEEGGNSPANQGDETRADALEIELETTRTELESALRRFEISGEEHKAVNEEALSVNEEYQSANEELLTSKEELQSLNEELTALNSQLQETLDRQRITSNDLQNVLYSTDTATLFLDFDLNIRFFTPTTRSLFNIIPGDIGRPLSDLRSMALDTELPLDVSQVLTHGAPVDREVETSDGSWFLRRVMPYRTDQKAMDGVVITFTDITERNRIARDLEAAKQQAELANIAKTRFLAAASHDLRQPLQSLALLQGLLEKKAVDEEAQKLVARLDETIEAMSSMLNTLLDINQFESGMVRVTKVKVSVNDIFDRLKNEFAYHAQARGLAFRVVPSRQIVVTDPALLEQLIRNLLSNAMKYTQSGAVLLGCRRGRGCVRIEVLDSGIGISETDQKSIFDEYYQVDNAARQRSQGLGLGLSIVRRLSELMDHRVSIRSSPGKGSAFSIDVKTADTVVTAEGAEVVEPLPQLRDQSQKEISKASVLVIEDDLDVRDLLQALLESEGHEVRVAGDGGEAFALLIGENYVPGLIIADYNLPKGMSGVQTARRLLAHVGEKTPIIILTGDVSTATLRDITASGAAHMSKPVRPQELIAIVAGLLEGEAEKRPGGQPLHNADSTVVYVVDDDIHILALLKAMLEGEGFDVLTYGDAESFLAAYQPGRPACLLVDAILPGMSGHDLLKTIREAGHTIPAIMITGNSDVAMAVQAMKVGAIDFLEKPVRQVDLLSSIRRGLARFADVDARLSWQAMAAKQLGHLTDRQREIMHFVLAGNPSKNIAADLGISQRTVENHRAAIMAKTGAKSLPALARLVMAADRKDYEP